MAQGIIDFATAGQLLIVTPFTLAGAMAPVTIVGALTLAHAEALAGITLAQITRRGAPVVYGGFTSNVDMKSGSPAFGTPEYVKACLGTGQLARHVGLPWRSSNATASNVADGQAIYESQMSLWGAILGGCNILIHGAGWLEGGLCASYEKFIIDVEMLQMLAEVFQPLVTDRDEIGMAAISEVPPGGHFFSTPHTMERYRSAFYAPMISDWRNYGQWSEDGALTVTQRANKLWHAVLDRYTAPAQDPAVIQELTSFAARRKDQGGAAPLS
jgi:trimethylamine--corrinoid protein Co-methyltransferase